MSFHRASFRTALLVGITAALAVPAAAQQPASPEVRTAIEAATAAFVDAFAAGDAAAVAARYAEDAIVLPPRSEPVRGRAAIQAFWQGLFETGQASVEFAIGTLETVGSDVAIETGTVTIRVEGEVVEVDNYLVVWKRVGGDWLLYRDTWNSQSEASGEA